MSQYIANARSLLTETCKDPNKIPGAVLFAADRSGNTLLHEAAGVRQVGSSEPLSKDALFWMASCTKLITAIAAVQLVEAGKLQFDTPIREVVPEIAKLEQGYNTPTTLRHLLNHTAGQSYPFFNIDTEAYFAKHNILPFGCKFASISGPLNAEPGTRWEYSTAVDWAGLVVEKASGLNLDAYFKKNIFEPLGIKNITLLPQTGIPGGVKPRLAGLHFREKDGTIRAMEHLIEMDESQQEVLYGGSGAFGNAREYCQILVALMNEGTHPVTKGKILSPASVKELLRDQLTDEKLIKDLDRPIPAAQPELTNPLTVLEGVPKNWAFAGCKTPQGMPTGRTSQGVWWAGIANHYWFLDNETGVCGMIQCQVLPFFDPYIVPLNLNSTKQSKERRLAKEGIFSVQRIQGQLLRVFQLFTTPPRQPREFPPKYIRSMKPVAYTPEGAVCISYPDLVSDHTSLLVGASIEEAFGSDPRALGIIVVRDMPEEYRGYRERLLKLAYKFAHLDENVKEKYTDPLSRYSFGWSHGKEIMNGKPDVLKGSYYANPVVDVPSVSDAYRKAYPEYYGKNLWPDANEKGVEGFEQAFKDLGGLIFKIGCELAQACQPFGVYFFKIVFDLMRLLQLTLHLALKQLSDTSLSLPKLISSSQTTKARLLHYFPPSPDAPLPSEDEPVDSWCGFHLDHSLLTGLCSAMFLKEGKAGEEPTVVPSPSPASGLYIRTRGGELTKVSIPVDCLAFQTGEALEVATGGKLCATPHCVRVGASRQATDISRETFALFMQPDIDQLLSPSVTFGQFSKKVFDDHYAEGNSNGATM
ncbi:hypothetical protein D9758_000027 [Tetrapyrgos nigripes]|uniref:Beta-lactamase-related domain-containing protein n=1 Tax=Tetrapyrgos nigripes TaxID=182062 RepID=A0A8H5H1P5_9AGAR|nr:hypothetical protein D9758_000027 [Tetrapyrgos nigripes]